MRHRLAFSLTQCAFQLTAAVALSQSPAGVEPAVWQPRHYPELKAILQASGEAPRERVLAPPATPGDGPLLAPPPVRDNSTTAPLFQTQSAPLITPPPSVERLTEIPAIPPRVAAASWSTQVRRVSGEAPMAPPPPPDDDLAPPSFDNAPPPDSSRTNLAPPSFAAGSHDHSAPWNAQTDWAGGMTGYHDARWGDLPCDAIPGGEFLPFGFVGTRGNNDRTIFRGGVFYPLWQDYADAIFADFRGEFDDEKAEEGNLGFVYRTYVDPAWIFGAYVYYDILSSRNGNVFHQATLGAELLSLDWDFRFNVYFPGSGDQSANVERSVSNGSIITRDFRERAYEGVDFEIGHRFLYWGWNDCWQVYGFFGGYYFNNGHDIPGFESFGGPKARIEVRAYDLPWLGEQSRIEFGAEATVDRMRDEQVTCFARVRIPFAPKSPRDRLDPLRRRMVDLPLRDID